MYDEEEEEDEAGQRGERKEGVSGGVEAGEKGREWHGRICKFAPSYSLSLILVQSIQELVSLA